MRDDTSLASDLESLKIAAREARQRRSQPQLHAQKENRTDIVHAGYRILQCAAAAVIFMYHIIDSTHDIADLWDYAFGIIYPACFLASFTLGFIRIMNFVPNPRPIIPLTISVTGWAAMLTGGIMAMRHAHLELDIELLTDAEVAMDPIFRHDLILCAMSLVGSSLYLVHAWVCYDCWRWEEKKKKQMKEAVDSAQASTSSRKSQSDSGMSSNTETEPDHQPHGQALALPGPSDAQDMEDSESGNRKSKMLDELKRPPETRPEQTDPLATLDEILRTSVHAKQTNVEDEPVVLYCCCVDLAELIKRKYKMNVPVHEFQVIHVM